MGINAKDTLKVLLSDWWYCMDVRATKKERKKLAKKARAKAKRDTRKEMMDQ